MLIKTKPNEWEYMSESGNVYTLIQKGDKVTCTCKGFEYRHHCKHIALIPTVAKARYPRNAANEVKARFNSALQLAEQYCLTGSYRRKKETIGDVDILIETDDLSPIADIIRKQPTVKITMEGTEILRGTVDTIYGNIQFDITRANRDEWATYLLYRTGSKDTNLAMRSRAKKLGLKLNEHGLWIDDAKLNTPTEEDVFYMLKLQYLEPEER